METAIIVIQFKHKKHANFQGDAFFFIQFFSIL